MIVITGAAGFIGSYLTGFLAKKNYVDLVLVDDFLKVEKKLNFTEKPGIQVDRSNFTSWLKENQSKVQMVIHLGARTDTAEQSVEIFNQLNLNYSKEIFQICTEFQIPIIYASSAATYGDGNLGFSDNHELIPQLKPLNPYGQSKQDFDCWVLTQENRPFFWAGLKFFNVYGPNEYHKNRMASVIFHAFNQIQKTGKLKLFKSHKADYQDGGQLRDFIYVRDLAEVIYFLMTKRPTSAIFNLGTGKARTFEDLGNAVFHALGLKPSIEYIDIPADIRDSYQYFTEADMSKLIQAGYNQAFTSLEDGVKDYVQHYLQKNYLIF